MRSLVDMLVFAARSSDATVIDVTGKSRRRKFVQARRAFARLARAEGYALVDIGEALGGRCHSTISRLVSERGVVPPKIL